jgi:hypothetical protein
VPIVLKSGSLNLLEHSGPLQVCNGIALLYLTSVKVLWSHKDGFDRAGVPASKKKHFENSLFINSQNTTKDWLHPILNPHNDYLSLNLSCESWYV